MSGSALRFEGQVQHYIIDVTGSCDLLIVVSVQL